jgi:hypothetical protein
MAGFDVLYKNNVIDNDLVKISLDEKRTIKVCSNCSFLFSGGRKSFSSS